MNANAIGLSALQVAERAIDVIGQNISNSSTPGYHRQSLNLAARLYDGVNGAGVQVQRVVRYEDALLRSALLAAGSQSSLATARLDPENQVETMVTSAGLDTSLGNFFDSLTQLSSQPNDLTLRRTVLSNASELTGSLNQMVDGITQLQSELKTQVTSTITDIDGKAKAIADLNQQISQVELNGNQANDLRDQRDQLISDLSGLVDIRVTDQGGPVTILAAGSPLVVGSQALTLSVSTDPSGQLQVHGLDPATSLNVSGGTLGGLLQEHNQALPGYVSRLNDFATGLMQNVDRVQATGLGLNGPVTTTIGGRGVTNATVPLNSAGLALPPQAGDLYLSVTDQSTGNRTLVKVTIDPATQSLNDVAAAITSATGGNVQGIVTPGGTLNLQATSGFAFDFAGRLPTSADNIAMNGTSVPTISGTFTGAANDNYSFQVVGNGTVGTTAGLSLEVRDGSGTLLTTLNVGQGYTPGTALDIGNGTRVALSAGTTNAGTFSQRLVAEPDTANILPALGINSFFSGTDAATIAVRQGLADDASQLAASRDGSAGDARNLERLTALRDQPLMTGGTRTLGQNLLDTAGAVGDQVRTLNLSQEATSSLQSGLEQQEQGVIGVDVNEEMIKLLEFQRMIESGSKYLSVANASMESIINILQ
jgi:flagellar hook-associated protein 1 FlgK